MKKRLTAIPAISILLLTVIAAQAKETWLFIGDSITQQGHYVDYIETWFLINDTEAPEIIDLGLSGETISGLSEEMITFPRACIHDRLDQVLDRVEPDVIISCYGMNCGIYHPYSDERFEAYQRGIKSLIQKASEIEAALILLTPTPYAGEIIPKAAPEKGGPFGYQTPSSDYDDVLKFYGNWILTLQDQPNVSTIDLHSAIEPFMKDCYPHDPIHPNNHGHELMAEAFLTGIGEHTGSNILKTGISSRTQDPLWQAVTGLVQLQRETYDRALLTDIGHTNPWVLKRFNQPLSQAEKAVNPINSALESVIKALHQ